MDMVKVIDKYMIAGILDDDKNLTGTKVLGIPVVGNAVIIPGIDRQGCEAGGQRRRWIVDINRRVKIFEVLESAGFSFPFLAHPLPLSRPAQK